MENFGYFSVITLGAFILFGIKFVYDQMRLFKAYKEHVDKTFQLSPFANNLAANNPITTTAERWKVVFGKYPKYPEVDRLAKRVRLETVPFFILFILFGISL